MSSYPGSPYVAKGGIVLVHPETAAIIRIISLQYNPESLTRSFQPKGAEEESGGAAEPLRLKGPPVETLKLEAELDATDDLEAASDDVVALGIHAQLAALETMLYPSGSQLMENNRRASSGVLEIIPMEAPLTLFIWSKNRILPVKITEFSVTEEAFDVNLNPVRAKISLGMRVLTVDDLGFGSRGGTVFMNYLRHKEKLAASMPQVGLNRLGITNII